VPRLPRSRLLILPGVLALLFTLSSASGPASADQTTLVPESDIANPGGWQADDGTTCGGGGNVCASRVDEDIDSPNDSDYIRAPLGADNADILFHISDPAPGIVTEIEVRFRAYKDGPAGATGLVAIVNDTFTGLIGTPIFAPLTTTPTDYSYTISGLFLQPGEITGAIGWVRGDVTNPAPTTNVVVSAINFDVTYTSVTPNPVLQDTCGLDIALVIDSSGSIVGPELDAQKDAFKGFVDALLPSTPSQLAVVDFDASATVVQGFTSDPTALKAAIDTATTGQFTNWDDALFDARTLFPNRSEPDLIIFASDGFPNSIGGHMGEPLQLFIGNGPALNQAILEANAAKADGIRIITLGVGIDALSSDNLALISSPDAVILSDFDLLADDLLELADELCDQDEIDVIKYYDANANGINDDGQLITGWQVSVSGPVNLSDTTPASFTLGAGNYVVSEATPAQPNWVATTPTSQNVVMPDDGGTTVEFGNVCLGAGGGFTIGFWGNKNGEKTLKDGGTLAPELALLAALNLRNENGTNFNPSTYSQLDNWLKGARATNMAYMLSAQLAAIVLNVESGAMSSSALVYAPDLLLFAVPGLNALGFISVSDLITAANTELGLHGVSTASGAIRSYQGALKDVIDDANNNMNFVQTNPCRFSFP